MRRAYFGFVSGLSRHIKAKCRSGTIERLERRTLLAAISWIGPSGGDWDTPGNWSGQATPSASDDVTIGPNIYIAHAASKNDSVNSITSMGSDTLNLSAGGLAIGANSTLDSLSLAATLSITSGATVTVSGPTAWTGGTIGGGGTLLNTGTMTLTLNTDKLIYTKIENKGTIDDNQGNTRFANGIVQNDSGAVWDFQNNMTEGAVAMLTDGGTNAFNNLAGGTVQKSTAAETVTFDGTVPFNNSAGGMVKVTVSGGSLYLSGGTDTGGAFTVAAGGLLDLTNGFNATFTGIYTGSGAGEVTISGGTTSIGSGGATFNFPAGMFQWTGGAINGGNTLSNAGSMTITGANDKYIETKVENQGTIIDNQGNTRLFNGTVQNDSGAVWDFQNSTDVHMANGGGTNAFNNLAGGIVQKSTTAGNAYFDTTILFNNAAGGKINISISGGNILLGGGGTDAGGIFTIVPGGLLDLTNGSNPTFTGTYTGSGGGEVNLASGIISIGTGGATFNFPAGLFQWTGGTINGGSTLLNTGSMILASAGDKRIYTKIENQGTIIDSQGNTYLLNGIVQNDAAGVWDFQNNATDGTVNLVTGGGTNAFNNLGMLSKSVTGANVAFNGSVPFNNMVSGSTVGVVNISASNVSLSLGGGGTDQGGVFTVVSGSTLDLTGGSSPVLTGSYTGSGAGIVSLASGTLMIGSTNATFNFPPSLFQWTGGNINVGASGGTTLLNAPTGAITLTGMGIKTLQNGTLENQGTIIDSQGNTDFVSGIVKNDASGVWDFQNNATDGAITMATAGGTNAFNNLGTLSKSVTGANVAFNTSVPFNNMVSGSTVGAVNISASNVSVTLGGGGTDQGGVFSVASGSTLDVTGGSSPTLTGTYTGSGAGVVSLASGILLIGTTNATFNFPAGLFQWTGGTINPTGAGGTKLLNAATGVITLTGANNKLLQNGTLENQGTIIDNQGNTDLVSGIVQNDSGGFWEFQNGADVHMANGGGTNAFNNLAGGTVDKLLGAGNALFDGNVPYSSVGTTEVDAASLSVANALPQITGNTLTAGTWVVSGGATLSTPGTITTIGSGATVTLSGPGSDWPAVSSAAHPSVTTVTSDAGLLNLLLGASLNSTAGMTNTGGLTLGTGSGSQSGSLLGLTSAYAQSSTGTLTTLIGGRPSTGEFGSITAGSVSLAGAFTGHLANGFSPVPGDQYILINNTGSSAVSGTFAGLANGQMFQIDGINFTINYNAGPNGKDVVLNVPLVVTSVVINANKPTLAGVQRSMVDSIVYTFSEAVNISGAGATLAVHSGQIGTVPTSLIWTAINPNSDGSSTQWAVSFSGSGVVGNSIANGVYNITLNPAAITSDANPSATVQPRATDTFYRLFGDINGDGVVNAADNFQLKTALSVYNAAFDANADGVVNAADNFQFKVSQSINFATSGIVYTI